MLEDFLKLSALQKDPLHLWENWRENKESPEHFQPLLQHFGKVIKDHVNKYSGNQYISKPALEAKANQQFLKACQTYDPTKSQLNTHVHNYMRQLNRFVGEHSNIGLIPEPRRQIISKYNQAKEFLTDFHEREATPEEITSHMNEALTSEGKKPISVKEIQTLQIELSKKDLYESSALEEAEIETGSKEHQAIMNMYHSTPVSNGKKHQFRLTEDEHHIFRQMFPLTEDGSLDVSNALKPKQIANKLNFSQPKVSRSLKSINKKLKNTIGILS